MGFFSEDLEPMVEIYQRETVEFMEECSKRLKDIEIRRSFMPEDINAIFRTAHTIKSSSAMMGLEALSGYTHRMEDLFSAFRENPSLTVGHETEILDLLYTFCDYIEGEMDRLVETDFQPSSVDKPMEALEAKIAFFTGGADKKTDKAKATDSEKKEENVADEKSDTYIWKVDFKENCQMINVRSFLLIKQIKSLCSNISYEPEDLNAKDAVQEIKNKGFIIHATAQKPEQVIATLKRSPFVAEVEQREKNADINKESVTESAKSAKAEEIKAVVEAHKETREQGEKSSVEEKTKLHTTKKARYSTVPWEQVVRLQDLTGELITANTLLQATLEKLPEYSSVEAQIRSTARLLGELEDVTNAQSLMPVADAVNQFYRVIREICADKGKQATLQIIGEELQVDRNLLEAMSNPLLHLLRNAADHGIEPTQERINAGKEPVGKIVLKIESVGSNLRFVVSDDGYGLSDQVILQRAREKGLLTKDENLYTRDEILSLIFLPGFSTAKAVSRYSGRGVGMDVVQSTVTSLSGAVQVKSVQGEGSSFIIEVPVSMTSTACIHFRISSFDCMLPIRNVEYVCPWQEIQDKKKVINGKKFIEWKKLLPVIELSEIFGVEPGKNRWIIVVQGISQQAVLLTDEVIGEQIVVGKSMPPILEKYYRTKIGVSESTVTRDGEQALVLNIENIIQIYQREEMSNVKS